jgi:short-subunit dehydrogenase
VWVVWLRRAAAVLVLAAGAIHLYLWFDFFHRVHVVGTLFLLNAAAGGLLAVALLLSGNALALVAAAGYTATTLAAFFVSTKWGLFGYKESLWGRWQEATGATELVAMLLLVTLIATPRSQKQ